MTIYTLLNISPPLYFASLFTLALICCAGWYWFGLTSSPRPAPVLPSFRRLQVLLPFIGLLFQVKATTQGSGAILIVQW
jgi:hypothetical protein